MDLLTLISAALVGIIINVIYGVIGKYFDKSKDGRVSVKLPTGMTYEVESPENGEEKFNKRISSLIRSTTPISIDMTDGVRLLEDVVLPCISIFKDSLSRKDIKFIIGDIKRLPSIKADIEALQQVVFNVLDNAVKYSPPNGMININGQPKEQFVELTITNQSNAVFDPEEIDNIFKMHYRGKESIGLGTGIGLAVARTLIEEHAGKISAESHKQLFTIKISLPIKQHPTNFNESMAKAG